MEKRHEPDALTITGVDKFYGPIDRGVHAVKNLTMEIDKGEIVALLGSSGCGKTSTLRMIAGFEEVVARHDFALAAAQVAHLPPVKRNVAMAFEGYSLYPPLTVRENMAFALKAARLPKSEVDAKVASIAKLLEIEDILERYPSSISGGQQQRASLGRALIREADLHLLDEPMGQLEPQLRAVLRGRIKHFIKERGLTAILVTHDQTEANALADRIAVMEGGVLQQFDTPDRIKERPANLFTGDLCRRAADERIRGLCCATTGGPHQPQTARRPVARLRQGCLQRSGPRPTAQPRTGRHRHPALRGPALEGGRSRQGVGQPVARRPDPYRRRLRRRLAGAGRA